MSSESLVKIPLSDLVPTLEILSKLGVDQKTFARLRKNSELSKMVADLVRGVTPVGDDRTIEILPHNFFFWKEVGDMLHHHGPYRAFGDRPWELPWDIITIRKMNRETVFPLFSGLWDFQMLIQTLQKENGVQLPLDGLSLAESWFGDLFQITSQPYGYRAITFGEIGASSCYQNSEELKKRLKEGIDENGKYRLATFAEVFMFDIIYFLRHHSLSHSHPSYVILPEDSPQFPGALMALGMEAGYYRMAVFENTDFDQCALFKSQLVTDEKTGTCQTLRMSKPLIRKWDMVEG